MGDRGTVQVLARSPLCACVSFHEYSNYGQKKNCGRVLVPKSSRRSFWSRCLFDAEISSPVIRVAISATTFNKMNVANQDIVLKRAAHYPQLRRSQEFFWRQVEKSWKCVVCGGWTPSHAIERRRPPTQAFKRVFLTPGRKILKCVVCGAWTPSHAIERRRTPSNSIARQLSNWFDINWRQKNAWGSDKTVVCYSWR